MTDGIYDYFEDIYWAKGFDASKAEQKKVWKLFNEDKAAFDAYIAEHGIDLSKQSIDVTEVDFQLWCWDMEE